MRPLGKEDIKVVKYKNPRTNETFNAYSYAILIEDLKLAVKWLKQQKQIFNSSSKEAEFIDKRIDQAFEEIFKKR